VELSRLKFSRSINAASQVTKDVEGIVGENITKIISSVSNLARHVYENWNDSWEERSGKKSLFEQQTSAAEACCNILDALEHLVNVIKSKKLEQNERMEQCKKIDKRRKIDVLELTVANKGNAKYQCEASTSSAVESNGDMHQALFKVGASLEEPIKDEPADDYTDIKQEEPIADVFCPSTGTSRPFDQMNFFSHQGMHRMEQKELDFSTVMKAADSIVMRKP
ncbi:hypothetical protein PENTCL1PPCAC_5591, partial [Pristionchus entomophagus]